MSSVEEKFYGIASAILATIRSIGQTFSMGISILVFAIYMKNLPIIEEYYPLFLESMRLLFIIFTILCFIGIFASLARGKTRQNIL